MQKLKEIEAVIRDIQEKNNQKCGRTYYTHSHTLFLTHTCKLRLEDRNNLWQKYNLRENG